MDYLMFCTGECNDSLRDRDLFIVRHADSEEHAQRKLDRFFREELYSDDPEFSDSGENYNAMVHGENLADSFPEPHYLYRMTEVF